MSDVSIILSNQLDNIQVEILNKFKEFQQAMINKDEDSLNIIMDNNYTLTHMSGKIQTKKEYIKDIMNGVLNYYHSTIIEPVINIHDDSHAKLTADVELDAKVYGIKGKWTLNTKILMEKRNGIWYLSKWDN